MKKTVIGAIILIIIVAIILVGLLTCIGCPWSPGLEIIEDEFGCSEIIDIETCAINENCYPITGPSSCTPDGLTCTTDEAFKACLPK